MVVIYYLLHCKCTQTVPTAQFHRTATFPYKYTHPRSPLTAAVLHRNCHKLILDPLDTKARIQSTAAAQLHDRAAARHYTVPVDRSIYTARSIRYGCSHRSRRRRAAAAPPAASSERAQQQRSAAGGTASAALGGLRTEVPWCHLQ